MKNDKNMIVFRFWILLLIIIFSNIQYSYSQKVDEYKLKAVYIYNFSLFAEWPDNTPQKSTNEPFIITVFGKNPFNKKLENVIIEKREKIKGKSIRFQYTNKLKDISNSNIVFISSSEKYNVSKIIDYVSGKPILTISDCVGYDSKGVMINMIKKGTKIKFNINLRKVKKSKIYISSRLLANANKIIK